MSSAGLLVTLIDPVITSHDAASTQQNQVLPYIPGALLLGAAARNYARASDPFRMFHSGAVRFGDALPYDDTSGLGFPVPKSLHRQKDRTDGPVMNLSRSRPGSGAWKRMAASTLAPDGTRMSVTTTAALKTAIDTETGKARDTQLFHIEALHPGQRFWAHIEADTFQDLEDLRRQLLPRGRNRLGRSRSAEFGRVELEWTDPPGTPVTRPGEDLTLVWALSDIALDPEATDLAAAIGLDGRIDDAHCFFRLRTIWPYNGYWHSRGLARSVVERGSVIAVRDCPLAPGPHWLGLHREIGCGRVLVAPEMLSGPELVTGTAILGAPERSVAPVSGKTPTYDLVRKRLGLKPPADRVEKARASLLVLGKLYKRAAGIAGAEEGWVGPGPTQWGAIEAEIRAHGRKAALFEGEKSVAREGDRDWEAPCGKQSFRAWLIEEWSEAGDDPGRIQLLAKAARTGVADLRDGKDWSARL